MTSQNPGERQASVPLFATICDFQDSKYVENCLKNGFEMMFNLVNDNEPFVVKSSLNGFIRIFEGFSDIVVGMDCIGKVTDLLFNHLENHKDS